MKIRPLFERILAIPEDSQNSYDGIEILEEDIIKKARIISLGSKVEPIFKIGDYIYFEVNSATNIKINYKNYIILSQTDVLAYEEANKWRTTICKD